MTPKPVEDLFAALDYRFRDPELLDEALTHPSAEPAAGGAHYDRLEFLGDRVLALVVSDHLLRRYADAGAGTLARQLTALVRRECLADVAAEIGLGDYLVLSASERASGGPRKPAILADACEALIAALYLDGGLEAAASFVHHYWDPRAEEVAAAPKDAKTALQEWAHAHGAPAPLYTVTGSEGPAHAIEFTVTVRVGDHPPAEGQGRSKRGAQQLAAQALLATLDREG